MLVRIEEIQDKGLELNLPIGDQIVKEAMDTQPGYVFEAASKLKASFKKISSSILLEGNFSAQIVAPCKRCGSDAKISIPVNFKLNMVPESQLRALDTGASGKASVDADDGEEGDRAGTFRFDDVDTEPFDGRRIDLAPIVREQLVLALPLSVLCKDDCKGVCVVCGQNLNEKDCGCERKAVDIRLAKLKDIKLN